MIHSYSFCWIIEPHLNGFSRRRKLLMNPGRNSRDFSHGMDKPLIFIGSVFSYHGIFLGKRGERSLSTQSTVSGHCPLSIALACH